MAIRITHLHADLQATLTCFKPVKAYNLRMLEEYRYIPRRSTPGNDIPCGQPDNDGSIKPSCRLCGGFANLSDACDTNPECEGFDIDNNSGYCGFLKGAAGRGGTVYAQDSSHYCKVGPGSECEGNYIIKHRADIVGNDLDCNQKDVKGEQKGTCKVSGYALRLATACSANPDCKAFTVEGDQDGYLKATSSPATYTEGTTTYVKA